MSGPVFFRMETFGLRARNRKGRHPTPWASIDGVVAEAARRPGGAPHVKGCARVEVIAGDDPVEIGALASDQARRAVDQRGHRLREDGAALIGCIASYPVAAAALMADPDTSEAYEVWRDRTVAWVQGRWGDRRHSIIEHRDEAQWHLHILIVPMLDEDRRLQVGTIHPGIAVRDKLQRTGASTAAQNSAYRAAMSQLLDEFHAAVGAASGQSRKSAAPRQRLTREQALIDRCQREKEINLREQERDLIVAREGLQRKESTVAAQTNTLLATERSLVAARNEIDSQRQQMLQSAETFCCDPSLSSN